MKSPVVVVVVLLGTAAFSVGLYIWISSMVRPRGEKVGETNLMNPSASLVLDGKPGDALFFRIDASIGVPIITLMDDDQLDHEAHELLRRSQLTVRATSAVGVERVATCSVSNGRAASSSSTTGTLSCSGMLNDCVLRLDTPGPWTVRSSVEWAPTVKLRHATLETRREAAAP